MEGGHLYAHIFEASHEGLSDIAVIIIEKASVHLQMLPFTLPLSFLVSLHVYTR